MNIRFDRGELRRAVQVGDELTIEGVAARTHKRGDALVYGNREDYRDHEELTNIVNQLGGLVVTLRHPDGLIRLGAAARIIGRVDAAWLDEDRASVRMTVRGHGVIAEIRDGVNQLSLGYIARRDERGYQRAIELDHLALVERARCGDVCSCRVDGTDDPHAPLAIEVDHARLWQRQRSKIFQMTYGRKVRP